MKKIMFTLIGKALSISCILAACMGMPVMADEKDAPVRQEIEYVEGEKAEALSLLDQKISEEIAALDLENEEKREALISGLDLEKDEEVTELISDLDEMRGMLIDIVWHYEDQNAAYLVYDEIYINGVLRMVALQDKNFEYHSRAWINADNTGMVIWGTGGDTYDLYYVVDHMLLGFVLGDSGGHILADEHLPGWALKSVQEAESVEAQSEEDEEAKRRNPLTEPYYEEKVEDIRARLDFVDSKLEMVF